MISPLTKQSDTELIDVISPSVVAQRWRESFGVEVGAAFRALPSIEYWRCKTTGLGWYSPADAAGSGELYAQLERYAWYYMAVRSGVWPCG